MLKYGKKEEECNRCTRMKCIKIKKKKGELQSQVVFQLPAVTSGALSASNLTVTIALMVFALSGPSVLSARKTKVLWSSLSDSGVRAQRDDQDQRVCLRVALSARWCAQRLKLLLENHQSHHPSTYKITENNIFGFLFKMKINI